jgi:hypothetical protein
MDISGGKEPNMTTFIAMTTPKGRIINVNPAFPMPAEHLEEWDRWLDAVGDEDDFEEDYDTNEDYALGAPRFNYDLF